MPIARLRTLLPAILLVACRAPAGAPPPVLTLFAAAFEGGSLRGNERCIAPGEEVTAPLWVGDSGVVLTLWGRAAADGPVGVALGAAPLPAQSVRGGEAFSLTYRAHPPRGVYALRLARPAASAAEVCIDHVAVSQP
jgi:hypothetical protein